MLTPEMKKLKEKLEGNKVDVDEKKLLEELKKLDNKTFISLNESLAAPSNFCKSCGQAL